MRLTAVNRGIGKSKPVIGDPWEISLSDLLIRDHVTEGINALRNGGGAFTAVYVFDRDRVVMLDEIYGLDVPQRSREIELLAEEIRRDGKERTRHTADGLVVVGHPIWLYYKGQSYLKGCFVTSPMESNAFEGVAKFVADLFSERISAGFSYRVVRSDYEALEQEVSLGSNQLITAIDSIGGGLVLIDRDMRIVWCNSVVAARCGADSPIGKLCHEVFHEEGRACGRCLVKRTFQTAQPQVGSIDHFDDGRGALVLRVATTPVFDSSGSVKQVLQMTHDITAVRVAEYEVSHYKHLIDSSDDYMLIADDNMSALVVNRRAVEGLGYSEEELIGRAGMSVVAESDLPKAAEILTEARNLGIAMGAIRLVKKDGTEVAVQVSVRYDSDSRVYECVAHDISERLRMEREIRERSEQLEVQNAKVMAAMQDKARFFRSVSHDLRTPLTSVIGFTELLLEDADDPLTQHQRLSVGRVAENAHRLLAMVNDLLDLSRLEAQQVSLELSRTDLKALLTQIVESMAPLARDKNLAISVEVPDGFPEVITDERKLRHIIVNLLSNAIKFTSAGSIRIAAQRDGGSFLVTVQDTGIGIPEADLEVIFEEFQQGSRRGAGQRGTGLGLAIARRMAAVLGGRVTVQSKEGTGSTFALHLPVSPVPQGRA